MNKKEIEKAIEVIKEFKHFADLVESPDEYFQHMQGHTKELLLILNVFDVADLCDDITKLLQHQLTNGWIPVSERLPEENGHYLVTYHEWSKGEYLPEFDLTYAKILRFYRGEFKMPVCCNNKIEQDIGREVIAWMPLPEPYREEAAQ